MSEKKGEQFHEHQNESETTQEEDIIVFKMMNGKTGEIAEIDVIHCSQEEWKDRPESRDSDWLSRRLIGNRLTALRMRT